MKTPRWLWIALAASVAVLVGVLLIGNRAEQREAERRAAEAASAASAAAEAASRAAAAAEARRLEAEAAAEEARRRRPNYVTVTEDGRYGYESALSATERANGMVVKPLQMFAYNGQRRGAHQLMVVSDADARSGGPYLLSVFDWTPGSTLLAHSIYRQGKFAARDLVRADPDLVAMAAMRDAERGLLKRWVHHPRSNPKRAVQVYCDPSDGCGPEAVSAQR